MITIAITVPDDTQDIDGLAEQLRFTANVWLDENHPEDEGTAAVVFGPTDEVAPTKAQS